MSADLADSVSTTAGPIGLGWSEPYDQEQVPYPVAWRAIAPSTNSKLWWKEHPTCQQKRDIHIRYPTNSLIRSRSVMMNGPEIQVSSKATMFSLRLLLKMGHLLFPLYL